MARPRHRDLLHVFPSGHTIDPWSVDHAQVDVRDIARALSRQPRFGGRLDVVRSVAEHCTLGVEWLLESAGRALLPFPVPGRAQSHRAADRRLLQLMLLHDAEEGVAGWTDLPTPVKHDPRCAVLRTAQAAAHQAVLTAFRLAPPTAAEARIIKALDVRLRASEIRDGMATPAVGDALLRAWDTGGARWRPLEVRLRRPLTARQAERRFLQWAAILCAPDAPAMRALPRRRAPQSPPPRDRWTWPSRR